jgi:hypothetical protein
MRLAFAHELWGEARPIFDTLAEKYLLEVRGIDIDELRKISSGRSDSIRPVPLPTSAANPA